MQPRFKLSLFEKGCDTFFLFVDQGKQEIFETLRPRKEKESIIHTKDFQGFTTLDTKHVASLTHVCTSDKCYNLTVTTTQSTCSCGC